MSRRHKIDVCVRIRPSLGSSKVAAVTVDVKRGRISVDNSATFKYPTGTFVSGRFLCPLYVVFCIRVHNELMVLNSSTGGYVASDTDYAHACYAADAMPLSPISNTPACISGRHIFVNFRIA